MKRLSPHSSRMRGAALTEFVIVVPLFLAMIFGSLFLTELGVFKLEAMEAARYAAWSFASKPLSNFENESIRPTHHRTYFNEARDLVAAEMGELYGGVTSRWTRTASVTYLPSVSDFRNNHTQLLPDWAQADWASPLSIVGVVLNFMGIGNGTETFVSGGFDRIGMNGNGQIQTRVRYRLVSPSRAREAAQSRALLRVGRERGADLWAFRPRGQTIRGSSGEDMGVTLIADPWRLQQGMTPHPYRSPGSYRQYANGVSTISNKAIEALPGGPIVGFVLSALGIMSSIPGLSTVMGIAVEDPQAHVFSRPMIDHRTAMNPGSSSSIQSGQVDIFAETQSSPQESGAVRVFDSSPMLVNPDNPSDSGYLDSLNKRGRNFMGCSESEKRGCWE